MEIEICYNIPTFTNDKYPFSGNVQPNNIIEKKIQFLNLHQFSVNFSFKIGIVFEYFRVGA